MNKQLLKEKLEQFRQWQREPFNYTFTSNEEQHCNNCGNAFIGNYCPYCSQKSNIGHIGWHSVQQSVMDIWGLGTRSLLYTIWQLLWRPGHLIEDYIDGKRQSSFPPVKMLFILSIIYALFVYWFLGDILGISLASDQRLAYANEFLTWEREHISWSMLMMSVLAIFPTWVMFRYSPRHTRHTMPEGFFIQIFLSIITVVLSFFVIPIALNNYLISSTIQLLLLMTYYIIIYRWLFGYSLWGTLWRQAFVLVYVVSVLWAILFIFFPVDWIGVFKARGVEMNPYWNNQRYSIFAGFLLLVVSCLVLGVGAMLNFMATWISNRKNNKTGLRMSPKV